MRRPACSPARSTSSATAARRSGRASRTRIEPGGHYPLDQGDTRLSEAELKRIHLQGYVTAIAAGVASIMPSYSSWNGEKVSGDKHLLTDVLKGELGFEGFLISDYNAIDELPGDFPAQIERSVNAGMDMFMVPSKYREFIAELTRLVTSGRVPMARIDDAVSRILRVKFAMGLMEPGRDLKADRRLLDSFGSAAHREVARQAVRESLVLLKNEHGALPLSRSAKRIHVAGESANDIGDQCGGWTITWQGSSGPTTQGTTIYAAIRQLAGPHTQVTYSADGTGAEGAAVTVVVVGEHPYAEMLGDRRDLALSERDRTVIANAKKAGGPVVIVLLSGRPLIVNDALAQADAFVAAWLPGTEGLGVADVLFGDHKPTGKLPMSWPRSMDQIPINVGDPGYDPLFAYGFGMSVLSGTDGPSGPVGLGSLSPVASEGGHPHVAFRCCCGDRRRARGRQARVCRRHHQDRQGHCEVGGGRQPDHYRQGQQGLDVHDRHEDEGDRHGRLAQDRGHQGHGQGAHDHRRGEDGREGTGEVLGWQRWHDGSR